MSCTIITGHQRADGGGTITENRVYHNTTYGIYADSGTPVRSNVIYSNPVGLLLGYYFSSQVVNNLIYANLNQGILAQAGYGIGFDLVNNTVYQADRRCGAHRQQRRRTPGCGTTSSGLKRLRSFGCQ